jgi:hypothetical protein
MMKRQATPDWDWLMDRRGRWLHVFGRLRPGITVQQAKAGLQPWFKAMLEADRSAISATAARSVHDWVSATGRTREATSKLWA